MLSGKLLKLGGGTFSRLQERDFVLNGDGTLDYLEGDKVKGTIEVKGSTIIDRGSYMGHLCFSIEGQNTVKDATKEYFLFTDDRTTKWKWVSTLQATSGRYTFAVDETANKARLQESVLNTVLAKPGNDICADCGAPTPSWAVVLGSATNSDNLGGVFVCIECVGVHRGMWPDRCKEVVLDQWSGKEVTKMQAGGNAKVNGFLEYNTDGALKPNQYSLRDVREKFIKTKYEQVDGQIIGAYSQKKNASPGTKPVSDNATKLAADLAAANLPPRYMGVVQLNLFEASNFSSSNIVVSLNNGYQEVKSLASSKKGSSNGPEWNQMIQVGIDTIFRPLYATFFDGDKIVGTSEIILAAHFKENDLCDEGKANAFSVTITGNNVSVNASLTLSAHLTRLA